jgi:hypothetical protein
MIFRSLVLYLFCMQTNGYSHSNVSIYAMMEAKTSSVEKFIFLAIIFNLQYFLRVTFHGRGFGL